MKRKREALDTLVEFALEFNIKKFIVEYSLDHDHRRSARIAGISPQYAVNLLDDPTVQEGIKIASASLYEGLELTSELIQEELFMAYNIAMQSGKIQSAVKLLENIARLKTIDAFVGNKITLENEVDIIDILQAGRKRADEAVKQLINPTIN